MPLQIITITMEPTQCATVVEHFLWDLSKGTKYREKHWKTLAGVFYNVNCHCHLLRQKVHRKISVIKTNSFDDIKKRSSFWHFNSLFALKTVKTQVFVVITENFWPIFWRTFWRSLFDVIQTPARELHWHFWVYCDIN